MYLELGSLASLRHYREVTDFSLDSIPLQSHVRRTVLEKEYTCPIPLPLPYAYFKYIVIHVLRTVVAERSLCVAALANILLIVSSFWQITAILGIFFTTNMVEQQLISTGAFEVSINGKP